jgi:hypothetical protein
LHQGVNNFCCNRQIVYALLSGSCLYLTFTGAAWHPCVSCSFSFSRLHSKKEVTEGKANGGDLHGLIATATRKKVNIRELMQAKPFL